MKKLLYIILILAVIGGGIFAWFYFSKPGVQNNPAAELPSVSLSQSSSSLLPASYTIADTFPKTETIGIGTGNGAVEVKNFYKKIVDTEEGFIIMADNENYQISYDRSTSKFYIDLKTETFSETKAENELLGILGIGQQDACKLQVWVFQQSQPKGTNLSFCTNGQ